ncbi:MAG: hypothetical protein JW883_07590 [Deltaproteobacteria bacterium]|nr:hypothetical protein [Deltaproteobacteria bacterium]
MKKDKQDIISAHYKKPRWRIIGTSLVCFVALLLFRPSNSACLASSSQENPSKAAIVDHLSTSWPNPAFVKECTAILEGAGYKVDYFKGGDVTVELYRNLPTHGYKLIILRVHSAYIPQYLSLAMFTSEPYTKHRYVYEQLRNRVASGYLTPYKKGDPKYLVITDKFVRFNMKGSFDGAVVLMMGCTGVKKCAASAFVQKGARAYIGWNGSVSASHTDRATMHLLRQLLDENRSVNVAVMQTMKTVGPDPTYNSTLLYWPIKAGNYSLDAHEERVVRPTQTI